MLYPIKNLIKPFTDSDWFQDSSVAGGTMSIDTVNPYRMLLTTTVSAQGRLLHIPVENGKTYTFSFSFMTGLYRFYKKKVITNDSSLVIVNHTDGGKPDTFTFTVDSSFQGFVTLRLTYGAAGNIYFENLQLEEGLVKTNFEPYKLGNKRPALPKETINSDMSGAGSHVYPYGNVIQVKEDVRLWGYKIQVGTPTGTFDSVIYEWNNGSIGQPLFREVVNANAAGVMNLSYGGTLLKAGKKYYIGRNDPNRDNSSAGNAGVFRKTAMPPADFKYISTLGGTQFYSPAIDFPSTWYYIFGLEIESQKNKPAVLPSKKNITPPFSQWNKSDAFTVNSDRKMTGVFSQSVIKSSDITLDVEVGKDYILSGKITGLGRIRVGKKSNNALIGTIQPEYPIVSFRATEPQVLLSVDNNYGSIAAGTVIFEDIQLEKNTVQTPYTPYEPMNKPAPLYPKKNFIPRQNLVHGSWQSTPLSLNLGSPFFKAIQSPIHLKKGVYTISTRSDVNAAVLLSSSNVLISSNSNTPQTFTIPYDTDVYFHFKKRDNTAWDTFTVDTYELGIQLEAGSSATAFEPYKLGNKPAVLYPEKNLLPPFSQWMYTNAAGKVTFNEPYKMTMAADVNTLYHNHHVLVEKGKTYTFSIGSITANARIAIREVKADNSKTFKTNLTPDLKTYTLTPASDTVKIEFDCTVQAVGTLVFENPMIEEGTKATPFEPIKYGNKK